MPPRARGEAYQGFSQTDVVSNEVACRWMYDRARELGEENLNDEVLHGDFPWQRFLMGRPCGQKLLQEGLTTMTLVSWDGWPAFQFTRIDHPEVRHIRVAGKKSWIVDK